MSISFGSAHVGSRPRRSMSASKETNAVGKKMDMSNKTAVGKLCNTWIMLIMESVPAIAGVFQGVCETYFLAKMAFMAWLWYLFSTRPTLGVGHVQCSDAQWPDKLMAWSQSDIPD